MIFKNFLFEFQIYSIEDHVTDFRYSSGDDTLMFVTFVWPIESDLQLLWL